MFKTEHDNTLLIYTADERHLLEEESSNVEKAFHDLLPSVRNVIVDLSHVTLISSHFINWLLKTKHDAESKGGQLILCSLTEHVLDILERLHLAPLFIITGDQRAAKLLLYDNEQTLSTV